MESMEKMSTMLQLMHPCQARAMSRGKVVDLTEVFY